MNNPMVSLRGLLINSTVKLHVVGRTGGSGTGFFVAPGQILTCAHVVLETEDVETIWNGRSHRLKPIVRVANPPDDYPDLLLLEISITDHPCVRFDDGIFDVGDKVYGFGYPADAAVGVNSNVFTGEIEGDAYLDTEQQSLVITFKGAQIVAGMSGSPVMNMRTGGVCGMVKRTRESIASLAYSAGGRFIPIDRIKQALPDIIDAQRSYHIDHPDWIMSQAAISPATPSKILLPDSSYRVTTLSRQIEQSQLLQAILIVTVTKVETQAVLKVFSHEAEKSLRRIRIGNKTYYDLGIQGGAPIFMVQSEMGIATPGGALLTVHQAILNLHPQAVIMCGIAFGLRPDKQQLGDILIAHQLKYYEPQKVDLKQGVIYRGDRVTASERLLDQFRSGDNDWSGNSTHFGLVLSGEKLVNDPALRDELLKTEPEAIGGEMEGNGLYVAARDAKVDWILIKAICDWGDGTKTNDAQKFAAENAANFVLHVLALGGWNRANQDVPTTWTQKLASAREQLVSSLSQSGEENIARSSDLSDETNTAIVVNTLLTRELAKLASEKVARELKELRSLWQEGDEKTVQTRLETLKNDDNTWTNADGKVKAEVLCFTASIALEVGEELDAVEGLVNEASGYASIAYEKRVRCLLLVNKRQLQDGLRLIQDEDDVDTCNLRAALLLDTREFTAASQLLSSSISQGMATAETYRLMALYQLFQGNLASAELNIAKARGMQPKWVRLELAAAIIAYYGGLSPAARPTGLVPFPLPIEGIFVIQDQQGVANLRNAERIFGRLATNFPRLDVHAHVSAWQLACLFNDAERQEEATSLCRTLLERDPTYAPAIMWAVSRNLEINFDQSADALKDRVAASQATTGDILMLVAIYEHQEQFAQALQVLTDTQDQFADPLVRPEWMSTLIRLLIHNGDEQELENAIATVPQSEQYALTHNLISVYRARRSGLWDEVVADQLKAFQDTGDPVFLFDACLALYQNKKWSEFAAHVDNLVSTLGTADSYRLAISGTYNAHEYEHCLALIAAWDGRFQPGNWEHEIGPIRISCLHAIGNYEAALTEAKTLVERNPSLTNTLNLLDLSHEMGIYDSVAVYAEPLKEMALAPEISLHIAGLLRGSHESLAQTFWRKAVLTGIPDEYTGPAVDLAFKLALENEIGDLMQRFLAYDSRTHQFVQTIHLKDDAIRIFEAGNQRARAGEEAYFSGLLPIHFYAEQLSIPLSDLFHEKPNQQQASLELLRSVPLFMRYGGRPLAEGFPEPIPNLRLFLDISAFLLAAHLEILDAVEQTFAPLSVPSEIFGFSGQCRGRPHMWVHANKR